jgi:hypothetical protein
LLAEGTAVTYHPPSAEEGKLLTGHQALDALVAALNTLEKVMSIRARLNTDDSDPRGLVDEEYKLWTGWSRGEFEQMLPFLTGPRYAMYDTKHRSRRQALFMFWVKLRHDLSFPCLASLMGMPVPVRSAKRLRSSDSFYSVLRCLTSTFVPLHLNKLTREQALQHNTVFSRALCGEGSLALILDGTYYYKMKSSFFELARSLYCVHSKRNLTKFMSEVLPDGYWHDTEGPFMTDARNTDGLILKFILEEEKSNLRDFLRAGHGSVSGDVLVVDKGFFKVVAWLKEQGYRVMMPLFGGEEAKRAAERKETEPPVERLSGESGAQSDGDHADEKSDEGDAEIGKGSRKRKLTQEESRDAGAGARGGDRSRGSVRSKRSDDVVDSCVTSASAAPPSLSVVATSLPAGQAGVRRSSRTVQPSLRALETMQLELSESSWEESSLAREASPAKAKRGKEKLPGDGRGGGGFGRGVGRGKGGGKGRGRARGDGSDHDAAAEEEGSGRGRGRGKGSGRGMGRGGRLTVWEANTSRLTTKLRWVVETCHREVKIWRFFAHAQPTVYIRHEHRLVRLLCAALNRFRRRPPSADTVARQSAVLGRMLARKEDTANAVWAIVQRGKFSSLGRRWTEQNAELDAEDEYETLDLGEDKAGAGPEFLCHFPQLTLEQLEDEITLGVYQVKLAKAYTREHRLEGTGGGYTVEVHPEDPSSGGNLLRVRIQSRHISKTRYYVWILWQPDQRESLRWCCTCRTGLRTIGCCAHVASVIWYLAVARHDPPKHLQRPIVVTWDNLLDARQNEGEVDGREDREESDADEEAGDQE